MKATTSIDLHGVRHGDVSRQLDEFLYKHILRGSGDVVIVTGNSDAMKSEVQRVLGEYGLSGQEGYWNRGELTVSLI